MPQALEIAATPEAHEASGEVNIPAAGAVLLADPDTAVPESLFWAAEFSLFLFLLFLFFRFRFSCS